MSVIDEGFITTAIDAARQAGGFLYDNFGKIKTIEIKGARDLATNLDKEAEAFIIDKIRSRFPAHAILAEESGLHGSAERDYLWIIDPLDGTHNFIRGVAVFGVSIGLLYKGDFFAGVIYMPCEQELYVGLKGNGAYKNGTRISVSRRKVMKECSLAFDSSLGNSPDVMCRVLNRLSREVFNVRMLGSSARVLSYIAEGKLDATVEFYDKPWDFAAGACIVREAGGAFTSLDGSAASYDMNGYVASNGLIHEALVSMIRREKNG